MISVFLVRGKKEKASAKENAPRVKLSPKWVICVALSVIGSGMFGVMQKLQQVKFLKTCDNEFMIVTLFFSAITLFFIGIITNGKNLLYILRHGGIYAGIAGLSNGATNLLNLVVNAMIPISIAAPTRSGIKIVISFLISLILFKEKLSRRQTFGVIIGATALILLNLKI
jgi:drug/metabolite transporter (DMT)-like permease